MKQISSEKIARDQLPTTAIGQRCIYNPEHAFPLWPPVTMGCPEADGEAFQAPVEVLYDYARVDPKIFLQAPEPDIARWSPLLPPLLAGGGLGEGGTALIEAPRLAAWAGSEAEVYIKDESRNPTWSHKDRLNRCTVSAAALSGAPGIVVASSGNHGASAAAYAARAGLACIVLASGNAPAAMQSCVGAYGAAAIAVPPDARWPLMREIVSRYGFQAGSNVTPDSHTGHGFGAEGYKTIAYELYAQLGRRAPAAVLVPTGYGEMLFGVWKGFRELKEFGLLHRLPVMVSCETDALGVHASAVEQTRPAMTLSPRYDTQALSIAVQVGGYRGVKAVTESGGQAVVLSDAEMAAAQQALAADGLWVELSSASSLAALRKLAAEPGAKLSGPVVCISTSCGFKDVGVAETPLPACDGTWGSFSALIEARLGKLD